MTSRAIPFTLPDQNGNDWSLEDHLAQAPLVLVFYRGDW
jgi:peroxiredoxin